MAGSEVTASQHPTETTATAATAVTEATKAPTEPTIDIDISHPEVKAMVDAAVKEAENQTYTLAPEAYVDVLEEAIQRFIRKWRRKARMDLCVYNNVKYECKSVFDTGVWFFRIFLDFRIFWVASGFFSYDLFS